MYCSNYTQLYKVYKHLSTLAITHVSCERVFSKLKLIKTRLRSTMQISYSAVKNAVDCIFSTLGCGSANNLHAILNSLYFTSRAGKYTIILSLCGKPRNSFSNFSFLQEYK